MTKLGNNHSGFAVATQKFQVKLTMLRLFEENIPWRVKSDGCFYRDEETGERELAFYPTSELAFSKWTLVEGKSQYPEIQRQELVARLDKALKEKKNDGDAAFASHSRMTFANPKRATDLALAKASFKALAAISIVQLQRENHHDRIMELEKEVKAWKARTESAGTAALDDLKAAVESRKVVKEWERAHEQLKKQLARMQTEYTKTLSSKDEEISYLKRQLAEVKRFTVASDSE